jgi:hypothetical protein
MAALQVHSLQYLYGAVDLRYELFPADDLYEQL